MPELQDAVEKGRLQVDGKIMKPGGDLVVTKAAVEPVWYLPGIAKRFGIAESQLRRALFEQTGGMFPELVTPIRFGGIFAANWGRNSVYCR